MRCYACDKELSDFEATRKSAQTGQYLDLCDSCIDGLDIDCVVREDLNEGCVDHELDHEEEQESEYS